MPLIPNARRFYLLKRRASRDGMASVWRAKQEAEPGAGLPVTFPFVTALAAAGYRTKEDLAGADVDELVINAGLSQRDAQAVLAAWLTL